MKWTDAALVLARLAAPTVRALSARKDHPLALNRHRQARALMTSLPATLVVVPMMCCYMDDLAQWLVKFWRKPSVSAT